MSKLQQIIAKIPSFSKNFHIFSIGILLVCLTGCASITTGQNQSVSIETPNYPGSTCTLTNDKGTWYVNSTPGSVMVTRAYSDMTVNCKNGSKLGSLTVKSNTKGMAFGNIITGGIIGAAVDCGTGAAYDYPNNIIVPIT